MTSSSSFVVAMRLGEGRSKPPFLCLNKARWFGNVLIWGHFAMADCGSGCFLKCFLLD